MPVFQGHTGNLLTVLNCIQDMQIAAVGLYGAYKPFEGGLFTALTAVAMTFRWVPELSGMYPGQNTLDKASASILALPAL